MASRLVLLRHGRPAGDPVGRLIGATDLPLGVIGQRQAQSLAGRLARLAPTRCFSSPMTRCRQTAAAAMPATEFQFDDRLREIDFGRWEQHRFSELAAAEPELAERWAAFAPDLAFPEGETLAGFLDRVRDVANCMVHDDAPTVLAVAHGGVIRAMICHLLGLPARNYVLFKVGYAGLVVLHLFDGRGVLASLENIEPEETAHG